MPEVSAMFGKDDVDESYFSSSPRHFSPPLYTARSEPNLAEISRVPPTTSTTTTTSTTRGEELEEFFGEKFPGMEETFRSVLLQYFTQVRINNSKELRVLANFSIALNLAPSFIHCKEWGEIYPYEDIVGLFGVVVR